MLTTERLQLRRWREEDRAPFAELNRCPRVCEYLPGPLSREESDALVDRIEQHLEQRGFGLYAVELLETGQFIGFTGLNVPTFDAAFTPTVEIGWRFAAAYWGNGFATEAAARVLEFAFGDLQLEEVVSFTTVANVRSRRVMEKIGLQRDFAGDFDHPRLPAGHPLGPHVLYRLLLDRNVRPSS